MRIEQVRCPVCSAEVVVDKGLWSIGTVRLRCVTCANYFLPEGSPGDRTVRSVTNANVPIVIWEPDGVDADRHS